MREGDWDLDLRKTWSCFTQARGTRVQTLWWNGRAEAESEASAMALRAAAMARTIAAAIDAESVEADLDEVQSCNATHSTGGTVPTVQVCSGILNATCVPERRALRRSSALSGRAVAAHEALFMLAMAQRGLPEGTTARADFGENYGLNQIGCGILLQHGPAWSYALLPDALREALCACAMAYWMSGAPDPAASPIPDVTGQASATLAAAQGLGLKKAAPENLRIAAGFLEYLKLHDLAADVRREFGP